MKQTTHTRQRFQTEWLLLATGLLIVLAFIGATLYLDHQEIEHQERQRLAAQAAVIDKNVGRDFQVIDATLVSIRKDLPAWRAEADGDTRAQIRLGAFVDAIRSVRTLLVTDAEGNAILSSRAEVVGKNFAHRDYFQAVKNGGDPGVLYVSPPFKTSLGVWTMNIGRMLTGPDGRFAGVVSATFDPEELRLQLGAVLYGGDMWAALAHADGLQILMEPDRPGQIGKNLAQPGSFFSRHVGSHEAAQVLEGVVAATGEYRLMALRTIRPAVVPMDKALIIAVGRDMQAVFAPWRSRALAEGLLFALLAAISVPTLAIHQRRRKQADAIQEQHFRTLFDNAPDGYLIVRTRDGVVIQCNRNAALMFGGDEAQIVGQTTISLSPERQADGQASLAVGGALIAQSLRDGHSTFEWRHTRLDGGALDVEVNLTVSTYRGEAVFLSALRDIAERKSFESRLVQQKQELDQAQAVARIGSWTCSTDADTFAISGETARLFGVDDTGSASYEALVERIHTEDRPAVESAWAAALGGAPFDISYRIVANGTETWVHALADIELDGDGRLVKAIGTVHDVTRERAAARQLETQAEDLAEERSRLSDIIEGTHAGTWEWNVQTGATVFNERWAQIVGHTLDELAPVSIETWTRLLHPDDLARSGALLEKHFAGLAPYYECEARMRHRDGHWVWVLARGKVTRWTADGKPLLMYGTHLDISAIKRVEEELILAKNAAESANQAKSAFLATMSHEIRTPLNALIGTAYLLGNSELDADQRRDLGTIEASGKNLLSLINDILDFSRIEAGELNIDPHAFCLTDLLGELKRMFAPLAAEKGIDFSFGYFRHELPGMLVGDSHRLRQCLTNLLGNALKFTASGSVTLTIEKLDDDAGRDPADLHLRFSVRDTGIGIDPEQQRHLFKPFSQADVSTTRRYGGSGLGLSIVRRLVELMGGRIGCDSTPGAGSRFWIELPFAVSDAMAPAASRAQAERALHVLVAEDDQTDRALFVKMGASFGWDVEGAENGGEMVERVLDRLEQQHPIDCIILDWRMPQLDGLAALAELKRRLGDVPMPSVIMVTAADRSALKAAIAGEQPDSILTKPVEASRLFNAVNEAVVAHGFDLDHVMGLTRVSDAVGLWLPDVRALVVDDSRLNLDVIGRILTQAGAVATLCESGAEALDTLQADPEGFDLVLMDLQMPGLDGCETTLEMRRRRAVLPIIALTAGATASEKKRADDAGMDDFLTKPVDPVVLVRLLRKHVERRRGAALPVLPRQQAAVATGEWPSIPGIELGLVRQSLGGDSDLYASLIARFVREARHLIDRAGEALAASDQRAAAAFLHRLRGQAGNVGALGLMDTAGALENAALNSQLTEAGLAPLEAEAQWLCGELDAWLSAHPDFASCGEADTAAELDGDGLAQLLAQLSGRRIGAEKTFKALQPGLRSALGETGFAALVSAMEALDFDTAQAVLVQIQSADAAGAG